jgi:hypothetical protein
LVQGASRSLRLRLGVTIAFAVAFLAGAVIIYSVVSALGGALQVATLSLSTRRLAVAILMVPLVSADVIAFRRKTYCPITWRRQTPRSLMRRYTPTVVAAAWGFDTGLAVTTFRVAALTWGALLFAFLGLAPWWIGIGYGFGFVVPVMALMWSPRIGRASISPEPMDPGLEALLRRRPLVQKFSMALLTAVGVTMALGLVVG